MLDCLSLLNIWKQRWLSFAGQIQIFKSLIASKPVYVSTMTTVCSLCGQNVETVTHLFFSCIESHKLWTEIRNWSTSCIILPELTEKIIFLGWFEDHPHNTLINHTILLYKQFIYKNRGAKSKINITGFRHFLKSVINTEKVIAKKRNKVDLHLKKWNPFLTLL